MFETLARLWKEKRLDEQKLNNAVLKEWITEDEKIQIMSLEQI